MRIISDMKGVKELKKKEKNKNKVGDTLELTNSKLSKKSKIKKIRTEKRSHKKSFEEIEENKSETVAKVKKTSIFV